MTSTPVQESLISFGKRLKRAREQLGLNGAELASKLGLERSAIPQYEAGRTFPSVAVLKKLTRILGISVDRLLFDEYEAAEEIRDKELAAHFVQADQLQHRHRFLVIEFIESLVAREKLAALEHPDRKGRRAA